MVVGTLGEIIVGLKGGITPFTENILALLSRALQDSEAEVRSNAAFAAGALIEWSDHDLSSQFSALMQVLHGYFAVTPETPKDQLNAKDNAVGCVARMIVKNPAAMPLDAVSTHLNSVSRECSLTSSSFPGPSYLLRRIAFEERPHREQTRVPSHLLLVREPISARPPSHRPPPIGICLRSRLVESWRNLRGDQSQAGPTFDGAATADA